MKVVELYGRVRYAVQIEGLSRREAARQFGIDPRTQDAGVLGSAGLPAEQAAGASKARPVHQDHRRYPGAGWESKQRHTSKRIFERLRDEHGYAGGITIVKDYVLARRLRQREVFVPLRHDPGHAQADFGEALAEIAGVERKIHFFAIDLPHSDACFVQAYPAETTEAFCDGHNAAFGFFGKVPRSILYDNTTLAVARILGDGVRQRTRVFSELQSHYLFADRFGRPGKGNDKGKVEGLVGWIRRNLLVPVPRAASFTALNEQLLEGCRRRLADRLRGHDETIGERLARDPNAPTLWGASHSRRPHQRHCGTGIWRDRDIAAGWRYLETPARLCRPGRQASRAHLRGKPGSRPSKAAPGERRTLRWREPDSNHRFRLRYSPSGSSLVVSAELSTLPSRKRSSQRTQRWREPDSNHRSPAIAMIRFRLNSPPRSFRKDPLVRIRLAPPQNVPYQCGAGDFIEMSVAGVAAGQRRKQSFGR